MDKILEINGIKYIQKSEYDKAKRDVDNIKQLVSSSIAGLNNFLSNQVVAQPIKQTVKKPAKKTTKQPKGHSLRNPYLQLRVGGQKPYKIIKMDKQGYLFGKPNRKLIFDIRDVMQINKRYNSSTNKKDIEKMAKDYQLPVDTIHRIIYNIDNNIFKPYIAEYLSSVNDIKLKAKHIQTQNNPQKRKEMGYS